jgi:hypothetical protein
LETPHFRFFKELDFGIQSKSELIYCSSFGTDLKSLVCCAYGL